MLGHVKELIFLKWGWYNKFLCMGNIFDIMYLVLFICRLNNIFLYRKNLDYIKLNKNKAHTHTQEKGKSAAQYKLF